MILIDKTLEGFIAKNRNVWKRTENFREQNGKEKSSNQNGHKLSDELETFVGHSSKAILIKNIKILHFVLSQGMKIQETQNVILT